MKTSLLAAPPLDVIRPIVLGCSLAMAIAVATQGQSVTVEKSEVLASDDTTRTVAERSDFQQTATYDEVKELCHRLEDSSVKVRLSSMGKTSRDREIPLLIIGDPPPATSRQLDRQKIPILMIGNIHAGEVCGKEALLMLAAEFAAGQHAELLEHVVLLIAPIYNADSNQPFSPTNRPGQQGPTGGVGIRANAQGLDLNRDHIKLESPEARGFVNTLNAWDPLIVVDTHTTNGSYHRYTLTYDGPRNAAAPTKIIEYMRDEFLPTVGKRVEQATGYTSFYYGNFSDDHRQWETYPAWPRYGAQYVAARGRLPILTEAYAYAPYRDRVLATREFVLQAIRLAVEQRRTIRTMVRRADREWTQPIEDPASDLAKVAIRSEPTSIDTRFTALGYDDSSLKEGSPPGTLPPVERNYTVEFQGIESPTLLVPRPFAYVVPARFASAIACLARHGIGLETLREDLMIEAEVFRIDRVAREKEEFQRHRLVTLEVSSRRAHTRIEAGSLIVPIDQPLGRLAILLLEPMSQDGLATWNFFDEALTVGDDYPVLRLPDRQLMLTTTAEVSDEGSSASRDPVTFRRAFGSGAINWNGNPQWRHRWFPDGEHLLVDRESAWWKVEAATGRAELFVDGESLHRALQAAGIPASPARRMTRPEQIDESLHVALWTHAGDLYAGEWTPPRVRRLTDSPESEELMSFSPDAKHVAFVKDFDLYVTPTDLQPGTDSGPRRLTFGGTALRRHGKADWVYYEEIYDRNWQAYRWSPDSSAIALMEFDDSPVRNFLVFDHIPVRGKPERQRYPKAGDPIPRVRVGVASIDGGAVRWIPLDDYSADNMIVTRFGWLPDSARVYLYVQDRAQRWLDLVIADSRTGKTRRVVRKTSSAWVSDPGEAHFLEDGSLLWLTEQQGWQHIERQATDGTPSQAVTSGEWEVRKIRQVDLAANRVWFTGTRDSHLAEHLYSVQTDGSQLTRWTADGHHHEVIVAPGGKYTIDLHSNLQEPPQVALLATEGASLSADVAPTPGLVVRRLDINPVRDLNRYARGETRLVTIPMRDGIELPGILILPPDFDSARQYPVWMMTYGGPHAFTVSNDWKRGRARSHMLSQQGILAFHFDPRSASGRGVASTRTAYRQLGVGELRDLEDAATWLAEQPFVRGDRIGIGGYSYGGFMAAYALTHSDKFAAGFAGAPVTDWRNYDAFYTERYMDTPQENPEGYERTSVIAAAKNLQGKLLIIHGAIDDNVHLQNTLQFAEALQGANKSFEMMIYPTSRHSVHSQHLFRMRNEFIRRVLLAD